MGPTSTSLIEIDPCVVQNGPILNLHETMFLITLATIDEIKSAIFSMDESKAQGYTVLRKLLSKELSPSLNVIFVKLFRIFSTIGPVSMVLTILLSLLSLK